MNILLCTLNAKYIHLNLAIRLLYEHNRQHEGLHWHEFTIKEDPQAIAQHCLAYDVVAFSCYIWNISPTLRVAALLKQLRPDIKILLGGPEVSYDWEDVIVRDEVDYIIAGEGEIPFRQFLEQYPALDGVSGLIRKENGAILVAPPPPVFDLNEYTDLLPYREDPPPALYNKVAYIETSRGCPYKCEFCLASLDNKMRYLPMSTIKAHLLHLMTHGRVIKFLDRTFNIKRDFTLEIFRFILEHRRPGNVFQFEITADILHPDIIRFIREEVPPGLFRFEIGIQTVNQKANLEVSRKQNFDKTKAIVLELKDKIEMHLDLIVGLALDYWDDIRYSFEEVFRLYAPELQLGFLKFLKGTPVRHKFAEHGFVFDPEPPYQIIESHYLSKEELHRITLLEHGLEIYWNKKRTPHLLRYVAETRSIFDFLLELGAYFGTRKPYHQYILNDVFDIAFDFIAAHFPDDVIMRQMLAMDYYLFFKIRPKIQYLSEPESALKYALLARHDFDTRSFRHVVLPLDFSWAAWERSGIVQSGADEWAVVEYDGKNMPVCKAVTQGKAPWAGDAEPALHL